MVENANIDTHNIAVVAAAAGGVVFGIQVREMKVNNTHKTWAGVRVVEVEHLYVLINLFVQPKNFSLRRWQWWMVLCHGLGDEKLEKLSYSLISPPPPPPPYTQDEGKDYLLIPKSSSVCQTKIIISMHKTLTLSPFFIACAGPMWWWEIYSQKSCG